MDIPEIHPKFIEFEYFKGTFKFDKPINSEINMKQRLVDFDILLHELPC